MPAPAADDGAPPVRALKAGNFDDDDFFEKDLAVVAGDDWTHRYG